MVLILVVVRQKQNSGIQERYKPITTAWICSLSKVLYCKKYMENKKIQTHCPYTRVIKLQLIHVWYCRTSGTQNLPPVREHQSHLPGSAHSGCTGLL